MYVHQITEFANQIKSQSGINRHDKYFLEILEVEFAESSPNDVLSAEQLGLLSGLFEARWTAIADTVDDYTFKLDFFNEKWIALAYELARELRKNYLEILFPTITRRYDPNRWTRYRFEEKRDLRAYYVGDDGETLYRMIGLVECVQKQKTLGTYAHGTYVLRALSIQELIRIRNKIGESYLVAENIQYRNFWDYIKKSLIPKMRTKGELPRHLLPSLLELLEIYFASPHRNIKNSDQFNESLKLLSSCLQAISVHDANCFYAQEIEINDTKESLMEILLDCEENLRGNRHSLHDKMVSLARWLCMQDASLIVDDFELKNTVYDALKVGTSFTINELDEAIRELKRGSSPAVHAKIDGLLELLSDQVVINDNVINKLKDIYDLRWKEIKGTKEAYTSKQKWPNSLWIKLAQKLAGAQLIGKNYYRLLMPTLLHDKDPVTKDILTVYPLSHYVLSDNGQYLILLTNSASRYKATGTFYNCNTVPASPFTRDELLQVYLAHPKYHRFINAELNPSSVQNELSVSYKTVSLLKRLVDGSLYTEGLKQGYEYTDEELQEADAAYTVFLDHYKLMNAEEKARLDEQVIVLDGLKITFAEVLQAVKNGHCVARMSLYIVKLILDYDPEWRFKPDIEQARINLDVMRSSSRKKVYREFEVLNNKEVVRRLKIIAKLILTNEFDRFAVKDQTITFLDCRAKVSSFAKSVFDKINSMIEKNDFSNARFVYSTLMTKSRLSSETRCLLRSGIWKSSKDRLSSRQTQQYDVFFRNQNAWYEPKIIFSAISSLIFNQISPIRIDLLNFLDDIVKTQAQPCSKEAKEIRINSKFNELLKKLNVRDQEKIVQKLNVVLESGANDKNFEKECAIYLLHRILSLGAGKLDPRREERRKMQYELFKKEIEQLTLSAVANVSEFINLFKDNIYKISVRVCDNNTKMSIANYLKGFNKPMVPLASPMEADVCSDQRRLILAQ